jgi:hypothetical protein
VLAAAARAGTQTAAVGRTGGRGAHRKSQGVRAAAAGGRAGRETGCPGIGGKRGLEHGQPSVMAATECVGGALFRKVLFPVIRSLMRTVPCLMWDHKFWVTE